MVRTDGQAVGRSVYGHVITKFSRMGSLPHFLTDFPADFYFKVTYNGILGEHYSFRDLIFLIKMFIHTNE